MNLRIHGDNILECEHAARVIAASLGRGTGGEVRPVGGSLWAPAYAIDNPRGESVGIQFFPGYGRWPLDIQKELRSRGAPLREMADAVVTIWRDNDGDKTEEPILSFEFCGALPAGNQAWQRCGRALNAAYSKIPYFYFAELGGLELDSNRQIKAGRLPNPIIPFAYMALGDALGTIALPVFEPSPSIRDAQRHTFGSAFGTEEAIPLVGSILAGSYDVGEERKLREKAVRATAALSALRRRNDTLNASEWEQLANEQSGREKANWLIARRMSWRKTVTIPVTPTFRDLLTSVQRLAVAIGTEELPICLLPGAERRHLVQLLGRIYGARTGRAFTDWLQSSTRPLAIVWIAGFKPRGDDSRPDRGLVPLARMIFGEREVDVLSVVYGPGRNLQQVINNPAEAAEINGLWEAILRFSNSVLIDSRNGQDLPQISMVIPDRVQARQTERVATPAGAENPLEFGENDVDSALHLIFTHALRSKCFECMCNPPGGDWSGLSFDVNGVLYRWTSLPRVTAEGAKRPDHVVQFSTPYSALLAIESKDIPRRMEAGIGPRLVRYVSSLLAHAPNITRQTSHTTWGPAIGARAVDVPEIISAAAFQYRIAGDLTQVARTADCDLILGFEFDSRTGGTVLHVKVNRQLDWIVRMLRTAVTNLARRLIVQIH